MTPTDAELLTAWRGGDDDAAQQLVERHFDALCRFFRSKLGDDVDDLIQRTFLDCVESRDRISQPSFRAYLFSVARNRLFDHLRAAHRRPTEAIGSQSIADLRTGPSQAFAQQHTAQLVTRALQTLPLDFQITLELAYWEELRGAEIAAALGVSEHTVRSRLSRGRAMLKAAVTKLASGPAAAEEATSSLASIVQKDVLFS